MATFDLDDKSELEFLFEMHSVKPNSPTAFADLAKRVREDDIFDAEIASAFCIAATGAKFGDPQKALEGFGIDSLRSVAHQLMLDFRREFPLGMTVLVPEEFTNRRDCWDTTWPVDLYAKFVRTLHAFSPERIQIEPQDFQDLLISTVGNHESVNAFSWLVDAFKHKPEFIEAIPVNILERAIKMQLDTITLDLSLGTGEGSYHSCINLVDIGHVLEGSDRYQDLFRAYNATISRWSDADAIAAVRETAEEMRLQRSTPEYRERYKTIPSHG